MCNQCQEKDKAIKYELKVPSSSVFQTDSTDWTKCHTPQSVCRALWHVTDRREPCERAVFCSWFQSAGRWHMWRYCAAGFLWPAFKDTRGSQSAAASGSQSVETRSCRQKWKCDDQCDSEPENNTREESILNNTAIDVYRTFNQLLFTNLA